MTIDIPIIIRWMTAMRRNSLPISVQRIGLVGLVVTLWSGIATGQFERANTGLLTAGATANYRFAETNDLPITVTVLGAIARPGRYEISRKIDLIDLIALAGGWQENADMSDVRISREKTSSQTEGRTEIRLDLEDMAKVSTKFLDLQEGDLVYVDTTTPVTLPLILSVISSAATVAIAVAYFTVVNR